MGPTREDPMHHSKTVAAQMAANHLAAAKAESPAAWAAAAANAAAHAQALAAETGQPPGLYSDLAAAYAAQLAEAEAAGASR